MRTGPLTRSPETSSQRRTWAAEMYTSSSEASGGETRRKAEPLPSSSTTPSTVRSCRAGRAARRAAPSRPLVPWAPPRAPSSPRAHSPGLVSGTSGAARARGTPPARGAGRALIACTLFAGLCPHPLCPRPPCRSCCSRPPRPLPPRRLPPTIVVGSPPRPRPERPPPARSPRVRLPPPPSPLRSPESSPCPPPEPEPERSRIAAIRSALRSLRNPSRPIWSAIACRSASGLASSSERSSTVMWSPLFLCVGIGRLAPDRVGQRPAPVYASCSL